MTHDDISHAAVYCRPGQVSHPGTYLYDDHVLATAVPRPWGIHPDPVILGIPSPVLAAYSYLHNLLTWLKDGRGVRAEIVMV